MFSKDVMAKYRRLPIDDFTVTVQLLEIVNESTANLALKIVVINSNQNNSQQVGINSNQNNIRSKQLVSIVEADWLTPRSTVTVKTQFCQ